MILYFADRKMNILGYATTQLKSTYLIVDDKKTEEVESGISSFECEVSWASKDRLKLETMMDAGNYILRSNGNEKDFFTIIETNIDTSKQTISVYAEDAGMDLLNEVAMPFTSDKAYDIAHYIGLYAIDTGFEIGINEIPNLTRKLSWDGETTCTERIASIATQFDNAEISYSFETKGLLITHKYINIFKKRGKDTGEQLRLGYEIASIATNKSVANLATSLYVTGGIPEGKEEPITLNGYKYDDGDFYVWGSRLNSRKALAIWSRYVWDKEPNKLNGYTGHIIQAYSYDTTSQQELCAHAITKLKKLCQMEVNYEADIVYLPENVKIGDRVNIVDNEGRLYTSTRVLKLETSVTSRKRTDKYHLAKTQYTLQFKYKTDYSSPVTFRVGVADTGYIIGNITAPADNTWRKFTATYTAPMTGSLTIRITSGTGRILIGVPKLEYGNKATDWLPAPEDLQDDATAKANNALASAKIYADAQIKVAADSISQNVSKVQAASIISSQEQFYQSTSPTSLTGGSWSNTQPAWASGKYIWRRTLVTYGNNKTGYTPSETGVCITGNTGATGSTGLKALQPLKSFTGTYTTIGSTASENVTSFNRTPVVGDTFINLDASSNTGTWQVTTVSNGTATFKLLSCVSSKGAKGDPGATGKGIKSTAVTYQASPSGTTVPTGTWVTYVPVTDAVNPYLWTRTVITYTDNTKSTSYAVGSTLEGVSVGGRNLILNGKGDKKAGFFKNFTTVTDEYGEFTLTSKKEWVNIDIGGGFLLGCRDYTVGEQVTWSYDIMYTAWNFPSGTDRNEFWIGQRYTNAPSGETATGAWTMVTAHGLPVVGQYGCELNKWFHVKKTLTIPKQASSNVRTSAAIQFYNSNANVAAGFTARLKNVKLERGNVATDWTPAPEDLATADNVNDKLTELRQEVNSNIEQTGEAIKSSVYEKVYMKDDVDTLLSSVNTEVEQTKTSWQVTFNQLVKQLNDYSDGSDAAFDEIRKYIRFEDGNILLGNSSSPLILRIRNDRIQFLQNGYEVAYISDQRMYNTTCEIINQLRIADSAWTVETNSNGDTIVSLIGL